MLALRLTLPDLRLITDANSDPSLLAPLVESSLQCGAALAIAFRLLHTKKSLKDVDTSCLITPDIVNRYLPLSPQFAMHFTHVARGKCSGVVVTVNYKQQQLKHRSPAIKSDLKNVMTPLTPDEARCFQDSVNPADTLTNQLFEKCLRSNSPHVLHLQLFRTTETEGDLSPQPHHSTLLIPDMALKGCWHVDTFPTDIRVQSNAVPLKSSKTRFHFEEVRSFESWFLSTYIPAKTPYLITASEVNGMSSIIKFRVELISIPAPTECTRSQLLNFMRTLESANAAYKSENGSMEFASLIGTLIVARYS